MAENFTPISKDQIPHYPALKNYQWVPGFLKLETLKPQIQKINREIAELKRADVCKETVLKRATAAYKAYEQRRVDWLASYLQKNRNAEDAFQYLFRDSLGVPRFSPYFTWDEIKTAIDKMPPDGIDDVERTGLIKKLETDKSKLEKDVLKCCPQEYFEFRGGKVGVDIREIFVDFWRRMQGRLCAPTGPRGIELAVSLPEEQTAWSTLGLHTSINSKGQNPHAS